jgi:hypothetical protein
MMHMNPYLHRRGITTQLAGDAPPATNNVFSGRTTNDKDVRLKAPAPMRANSESASNEIDESESQYEKHDE